MNDGMIKAINAMREASVEDGQIFHKYIPALSPDSDISVIREPILKYRVVENAFMNQLINVIVEQRVMHRVFNNKLRVLQKGNMPLGYTGMELGVNPVKGEKFNANDTLGLLQKYEADVKVQYYNINIDNQYKVSVGRKELRKAFTSWNNLDNFVDEIVQALYNAMYIDDYRATKAIVSNAYRNYTTPILQVDGVTTEEQAKAFLTQARTMFLNFDEPSTQYNGWSVAGDGTPFMTWSDNDRKVMLIRNDILAYLDINVLASAFHIDSAKLMGRVIGVDNFDIYDGVNKIYDGSNILALLADESWFRLKEADVQMDMFYNANNRMWTYFLNNVKSFTQNILSNGVIFATALPDIKTKSLTFNTPSVNISPEATADVELTVFPAEANPTIEYTSSNTSVFTVAKAEGSQTKATITGVANGNGILIAKTDNGIETSMQVNVVTATRSSKGLTTTQVNKINKPDTNTKTDNK